MARARTLSSCAGRRGLVAAPSARSLRQQRHVDIYSPVFPVRVLADDVFLLPEDIPGREIMRAARRAQAGGERRCK